MKIRAWLIIIAMVVLSVAAYGEYEITWHSIDGGGGTSVGGTYSLTGTIGQADAGVVSADGYVLSGGFWAGSFGCIVNLTDLLIVAEHWMDVGPSEFDLDGLDGIKLGDFAELSYWWYDACPADWPLK